VQGAGKSHTLGVVLESCLLPCNQPADTPIVRLQQPMTALVLHYDQNITSMCEAAGLLAPARKVEQLLGMRVALPREKVVVLVSPSYYKQRHKFYGSLCDVKPLLFRWSKLTADHLKKLMRLRDGDQQLYVSRMLDLLRKYQRAACVPEFEAFMSEVTQACDVQGQSAPLQQRIQLLQSVIYESSLNADLRAHAATDLSECLGSGRLVVADLTDPLLATDEVNVLFQLLVDQFRTAPLQRGVGRLLALDEAHRFMDGVASDGLSGAIVSATRLMRHDGLRVAVST
jgi:hypothetical protein